MENVEARILLKNLLQRLSLTSDGKKRLEGTLTDAELKAIQYAVEVLGEPQSVIAEVELQSSKVELDLKKKDPSETISDEGPVSFFELNSSVQDLGESPSGVRLCLDFGTAMSKATLVDDNKESIHVLRLGEQGDQEVVNEPLMLVSSIYIDNGGLLWFGQQAIEKSLEEDEDGSRLRIDSVKASISDGGLSVCLDKRSNPTSLSVTYGDMVLANLMFLTWAVNHCVEDLGYPRNLYRRFAVPCLQGQREKKAIQTLGKMLGDAQILADTYLEALPKGIPLEDFMASVEELGRLENQYNFIGEYLTEPLGVAGSRMTFERKVHSYFLVVDVGAGTTDFGLFKVHYDPATKTNGSVEAEGSARVVTEAGNHLDELLMHYVLSKAAISQEDAIWTNVFGALQREIRSYKETLFNEGDVVIPLLNSEIVELTLGEFLSLEPVIDFRKNLMATVDEIFDSVDKSWVRSIPQGRLGVVLTGGGAQLPMIKAIANKTVNSKHGFLQLQEAVQIPSWLSEDYPELEDDYGRVAVSLGGAREQLVRRSGIARITAGDIKSTPKLGGFYIQGS
jgi:hypothetical protein